MSRDLYPALSGAMATWTELEVTAHNLANATTAGYKEQRVGFSLVRGGDGPLGDSFAQLSDPKIDRRDGGVQHDGVTTHLALSGPGFFVIERDGERLLTRNGTFLWDPDGRLVTPRGEPVMGEGGAIELPQPGARVEFARDGSVLVDGQALDVLAVEDAVELDPLGDGLYRAPSGSLPATEITVTSGALESSNADALRGIAALTEISRNFEAFQKAMQTSDQLDGRINEVGRAR